MFKKYLIVSALSLVVDYASYVAMIRFFAVPPPLAAAGGYLVGLVVNYLLATRYVFLAGPLSGHRFGEFLAYATTGLAGMAVSAGTVWACDLAGVSNIHIDKATAVAVSFFVVYALRKFVLFREAGAPRAAGAR